MDATTTLESVTRQSWDLVLLDLNMPGASGLTLLAEVKRRRPDTPVLVLTVASESAYAVQSVQTGAAGFVNKRDAADELVAAARKVLFGGWEGNWIAYNTAHDVSLPGAKGPALEFLMYPQAETAAGRLDCLDPDTFKYAITAKEVNV